MSTNQNRRQCPNVVDVVDGELLRKVTRNDGAGDAVW